MTTPFRRIVRIGATVAACALAATGLANAAPSSPKIVGGQRVSIKDYPWAVYLLNRGGTPFCGGTLIAPNKVLTAAHCIKGDHAGSADRLADRITDRVADRVAIGREDQRSTAGEVVGVRNIWVDPGYAKPATGADVSVLTLVRDVNVRPLPLAGPRDAALYRSAKSSEVLGWGAIRDGGRWSRYLMKTTVPIDSDAMCAKAYPEYRKDAMVCAGPAQGGRDSCDGDSGGPLVAGGKLIGVVSYGRGCGRPGFPGIYARVSTYRRVINAT
jgi:trypsin